MLVLFAFGAAHAGPLDCAQIQALSAAAMSQQSIIANVEANGFLDPTPSCLAGLPGPIADAARAHMVAPAEVPGAVDVDGLIASAMAAYRAGDTPGAKAALADARAADPKNLVVARALAFLANPVVGTRVGGWTLKADTDEMSGRRRLYATLSASETVQVPYRVARPSLILRCDEELSLFVPAGSILDADYGELWSTTGKVRVDEKEALPMTFGIGDSRDAAFFEGSSIREYALELTSASMFRIQLNYYGVGAQVAKFAPKGAAEIVPLVLGACSR